VVVGCAWTHAKATREINGLTFVRAAVRQKEEREFERRRQDASSRCRLNLKAGAALLKATVKQRRLARPNRRDSGLPIVERRTWSRLKNHDRCRVSDAHGLHYGDALWEAARRNDAPDEVWNRPKKSEKKQPRAQIRSA